MKKILQIRRSSNKLQLSSPINSQIPRKQSQANLPPINSISSGESQKTLLVVLKSMQTYAQLHPGNISKILNSCLNSIYKGFPEVCCEEQNLSVSSVQPIHKKMVQLTEGASLNENFLSKSQMMNMKRTELKKVDSRKLFEKAKAANCEEAIIKSDKQALMKLKKQLGEMRQQLARATSKIQQLEKTLQNNKKYAEQAVSAMVAYQQKLKAETKKNQELQLKIFNLNEDLNNVRQTFWKDIEKRSQQIESLKVVLEQRENEVKALWILCHSQVKK